MRQASTRFGHVCLCFKMIHTGMSPRVAVAVAVSSSPAPVFEDGMPVEVLRTQMGIYKYKTFPNLTASQK